jgi:hypothetical protein
MRLDVRAVEQDLGGRTASRSQGGERRLPHAFLASAHEPVVQRLVRAVVDRCILLPAARPQNVYDTADHPPIVDPRHAARIVGQISLKPCELLFRQPEGIRHPNAPAVWELEADRRSSAKTLYWFST